MSRNCKAYFLKSIRVIGEATPKFLGEDFNADVLNVVAIYWQPPDILVSDHAMENVLTRFGGASQTANSI